MLIENEASGEVFSVIPGWEVSTIGAKVESLLYGYCTEFTTDDHGNFCLKAIMKNPDEFKAYLQDLAEFPSLWPVKVRTKVFPFMDEIARLGGSTAGVLGEAKWDSYLVAEFLDTGAPVAVFFE